MSDISLKCRCGEVEGIASGLTVKSTIRIVCHCNDCQEFANYLADSNKQVTAILDDVGGTEIIQMPLAYLQVTRGETRLQSMRLTPKGMIRWYTECCNTPVGNTISGRMAFIGVIHSFIDKRDTFDKNFGPIQSYLQTEHALQSVDSEPSHRKYPLGLSFKIMRNLLVWKMQGLDKPSVLFNENAQPISPPTILNEVI